MIAVTPPGTESALDLGKNQPLLRQKHSITEGAKWDQPVFCFWSVYLFPLFPISEEPTWHLFPTITFFFKLFVVNSVLPQAQIQGNSTQIQFGISIYKGSIVILLSLVNQ